MVSRDRMTFYFEQSSMAELGVLRDVSRRNHDGGWYACVEEHLNQFLGWVLSGPRRQLSIDGIMRNPATGRN